MCWERGCFKVGKPWPGLGRLTPTCSSLDNRAERSSAYRESSCHLVHPFLSTPAPDCSEWTSCVMRWQVGIAGNQSTINAPATEAKRWDATPTLKRNSILWFCLWHVWRTKNEYKQINASVNKYWKPITYIIYVLYFIFYFVFFLFFNFFNLFIYLHIYLRVVSDMSEEKGF